MGDSAGPYQPEKGWETRWVKQALDLLISSPEAVAKFLMGVLLIGIVSPVISEVFPGVIGQIISKSALSCAGGFLIIYVISALMQSEGYNPVSNKDGAEARKDFLSAIFLVVNVIITLAVVLYLARFAFGASPVSASIPDRGPAETFFRNGVYPLYSAMMAGIFLNPLWVALVPSQGMRFDGARFTQVKMFMRIRPVWITIAAMILLVPNISIVLPGFVQLFLPLIMIAWLYVAAREVFGGIGSNNTESSQVGHRLKGA